MGKINFCQFRIRSPHVAYKIFYTIPFCFWDRRKINSQMPLCPVGEDIQNAVFYGICQNTLVFTGIRISFEFINRKDFGKPPAGIGNRIQNPVNGRRGNIGRERKLLNTLIFMQGVCKKSSQPGGTLEIAW